MSDLTFEELKHPNHPPTNCMLDSSDLTFEELKLVLSYPVSLLEAVSDLTFEELKLVSRSRLDADVSCQTLPLRN